MPDWSPEIDLEFNEGEEISFAFLSITAPGPQIVPRKHQANFCRQANEYTSSLCQKHPTRYGFFATVPDLLDPAVARQEIEYALDKLGADGVTLYTRYGEDNHYLGHADFREIWDYLDSRRAVVFVHPTHPVDTTLVNSSLPQPMIDYTHETTRTAVDLITSGTLRAHPNVKIILSHAGGTLPYLAMRPAVMLPYILHPDEAIEGEDYASKVEHSFMEDARRFYFDTALSTAPLTLGLLKQFALPDHVLFGSDFPYAPKPGISKMNKMLDEYGEDEQSFVQSVHLNAALQLFPRLVKVLE